MAKNCGRKVPKLFARTHQTEEIIASHVRLSAGIRMLLFAH